VSSPPPAREQVIARLLSGHPQVVIDRLTGQFRQFKLDWSAGLLLSDGCAVACITALRNVVDFQCYDVAATQLAVYGEIEKRQFTDPASDLELGPD
jgi:hypothetical protein